MFSPAKVVLFFDLCKYFSLFLYFTHFYGRRQTDDLFNITHTHVRVCSYKNELSAVICHTIPVFTIFS